MFSQLVRMLLCLAAFLALIVAINLVANPYGAWPVALIDRTYLRMAPGVERMATPYRVRAEAPTLLLVGTSRMLYGMWIEQGYREGVLNAGLPDGSLDEAVSLIELAMRGAQLQRIVWGVDFVTFTETRRGMVDRPTQVRLAGDLPLRVRETLLSMDALRASGAVLLRAAGGRSRLPAERLLPVPWPPAALRAAFEEIESSPADGTAQAWTDGHARQWLARYGQHRRSEAQWELFRRTVRRIREGGIDLTLLVAPLSVYELETIRQTGAWPAFQTWKRELASMSPYWDFSGYNGTAAHDAFYTFPTFCHFKVPVGHAVLRRVLGGDCRECGPLAQTLIETGVWVEPSTVDAHLAAHDAARERLAASRPEYPLLVSRISRLNHR